MRGKEFIKGKKILLGVTGSIAAYKAVLLLRRLVEAEAHVTVVMTAAAKEFVAPLTFEVLSGQKVHTDLFLGDAKIQHLSLAEESDLILVAPATANVIGKMANGVADDLLTTILSATQAPVVVAPAMDGHMWDHPVLRRNISTLEGLGVRFVSPESGPLASGKSGVGRLASEDAVFLAVKERLAVRKDFLGEIFLVTAGPTREPIDPVRFISNRSSGKMGYAIARAALNRGARVVLVSGPTFLTPPAQAETFRVETSQEMRDCVMRLMPESTVVVMAAAISDYRPRKTHTEKIKRDSPTLNLELESTADLLKELALESRADSKQRILIGFSAETSDLLVRSKAKLEKKGLDLIVANDVSMDGAGFDSDTNIVTLMDRVRSPDALPILPKQEVAERILDRIQTLLTESQTRNSKKTRIPSPIPD